MAPTKSGLKRELLSSSAPCNFVSKTKQLLEEIEQSKYRIGKDIAHEVSKDINQDETKEYYNMIDTSVTDQDALEWIRLRRLLRDSIKATEIEVQDHVKKLLAGNRDCQKVSPDDQPSNLNMCIPSSGSASQKSLQSTTSSKGPSVKSCCRTSSPHQRQPVLTQSRTSSPYTCQPLSGRNRTSSSRQCQMSSNPSHTNSYQFQPVPTQNRTFRPHQSHAIYNRNKNTEKNDVSFHTIHQKQIKNINNNDPKEQYGVFQDEQHYTNPNILPTDSVVNNGKVPLILDNELMTNTEIYPSLYSKMKFTGNYGKYFPCAIPLADPSRKREEVPSDYDNSVVEQAPSNTAPVFAPKANVLVVNIDAEKRAKPRLVDQRLPSMDIRGKPFRPVIQNNAQVISIRAEEPSAEKADKDIQVSTERETDHQFHSHNSNAAYTETEQNRDPEQSCQSCHQETRLNPAVLSEIIAAIRRSQKEIQSANGKVSNPSPMHTSSMNISDQEIPCKNFNNQTLHEKEKSVKMETKETQANCEDSLPSVASESVQVSPPINPVTEKSLQTEVEKAAVSEHCVQTDLQGQLGSELVFKQRNAGMYPCCATQCDILPLLPNIVRTSTPVSDIGDEIQNFHPPVSDLSQPESNKYESDRVDNIRKVASKDISTQCYAEVECQTLPEMSSVNLQTEFAVPCISVHTMTTGIESNDTSVQVSLDRNPVNLQRNAQADSVIKRKEIGIQSEILDISTSSATVSVDNNASDTEFVDDLLSEGEVPLPWNLRLLSLIDRTIGHKYTKTQEPNGENGNSLSEGEIPPHLLQHLRDAMSSENTDFTVFPSGTDTSLDLISKKPSCHLQTAVTAGQTSNTSVTETSSSSSDLVQPSTSGDIFSEGEIVSSHDESTFRKTGFPRFPAESFEFISLSTTSQVQSTKEKEESPSDSPQRAMSQNSDPFFAALSNFFSGTTCNEKGQHPSGNEVTATIMKPSFVTQDNVPKQSEKSVSRAPDLNTVTEESSSGNNSLNDQLYDGSNSTQTVQTVECVVNALPRSESEKDFGSFYDVPKIVIEDDPLDKKNAAN